MDPAPADPAAQETSPHLPIFERPCYIKKQYERTMAFITTIGRKNSTNGGLRGAPAGTRIRRYCHK